MITIAETGLKNGTNANNALPDTDNAVITAVSTVFCMSALRFSNDRKNTPHAISEHTTDTAIYFLSENSSADNNTTAGITA